MEENNIYKNFAGVKTWSLINKRFIYIDHKNYAADNVFIEHHIPVKFQKEWEKDGYRIIMIKINRRYKKDFLKCMLQLDKKLMLLHGQEYTKAKERIFKTLNRYITDHVTEYV